MRYALLLTIALGTAVAAQQPAAEAPGALTSADYARAERFMAYNTTPLVLHSGVRATWLPDDRFWYRTTTENGEEAVLVDAAHATRTPIQMTHRHDLRVRTPRNGSRRFGVSR